jgi:ubiquitin carboxyl-terminal hydrolase L5
MSEWTTIESDPSVFTELLQKIGTQGLEVAELESLDELSLTSLGHTYGLIFLFKWDEKIEREIRASRSGFATQANVYFAKQVIQNACATQAIVNTLMNCREDENGFRLGDELSRLKEFTKDFDKESKGLAISNSNVLRSVHNSFRPPSSHLLPDVKGSADGDAFHYIAYVPIHGNLYELDGLQDGPYLLSACDAENWLYRAVGAIQERMARYEGSEQRFSVQAIIRDRSVAIKQKMDSIQGEISTLERLEHQDIEVRKKLFELQQSHAKLVASLRDETEKKERWKKENAMRRTDFTPFIFTALTLMGQSNLLDQEALSG